MTMYADRPSVPNGAIAESTKPEGTPAEAGLRLTRPKAIRVIPLEVNSYRSPRERPPRP
jgi:hypothetical protein